MTIDRPLDHAARWTAAAELEKNVLLLAGAGTGKTTLLIDRLAALIVGKGVSIERIVALTFTKKAAEEMRVRLEAMLRGVIQDIDGNKNEFPHSLLAEVLSERHSASRSEFRERARLALENIPRSQIGTIHSFAGYLIRLYPLQSRVDPGFVEDKGIVAEERFYTSWLAWVRSELAKSGPRTNLWKSWLTEAELDDAREFAWTLTNPRLARADLSERVDLRPLARAAGKELDRLLSEKDPPRKKSTFIDVTQAMARVFNAVQLGEGHVRSPISEADLEWLSKPLRAPSTWDEDPSAKEDLRRLFRLAKMLSRVDEERMAQLIQLVSPFVSAFRVELNQAGVVSFDNLLVLARDLVHDHPDVRSALKKQFDVFLIDEFQDTDPLQGEIIFYLAESPESSADSWKNVRLGEGRLFVVGDPKQSIYRFRGADIAAFDAFQKIMTDQNALVAHLTHNFRSGKPILDLVNRVLPFAMKAEPGLQPAYVPLQTVRPTEKGAGPLFLSIEVKGRSLGDLSSEERRSAEGMAVASWIQSYLKEDPKGRAYSDIAILFRSTAAFRPYLDALRRVHIPYLAEGEKFFYHTPEVLELANVLAAAEGPENRLALAGVLRSTYAGLTDREILELHRAGGLDWRTSPHVHADKAIPVFEMLRRLHAESIRRPLESFIDFALEISLALPLAAASLHGEQAVANLQKVRSLAEAWSRPRPIGLSEFLLRLRRQREDEKEEGENPLADVNYDAVKVMTVHKAKGLEFKTVVLADLHREKRPEALDPALLETDWRTGRIGLRIPGGRQTNGAMVLLEEEIGYREEAEEVRIFYVALTRARDRLILPVCSSEMNGVYAGYFSAAGEISPIQSQTVDLADRYKRDENISARVFPKTDSPSKLASDWKRWEEESERIRKDRRFDSPTRSQAEPDKARWLEEGESVDRDRAIRLGLVCHKVLEDWTFSSKDVAPTKLKKAVEKAGRLFELIPGVVESDEVLSEAAALLETFFAGPTYARLCKMNIIGKEIPFLYAKESSGSEGSVVMRGVMDLVYENEKGELVVADYKTSKISGRSLEEAAAAYTEQGEAYREALRRVLKKEAKFEVIFLRETQPNPA